MRMGKEGGELWDDSALINAFDTAFNKYKMMHGMTQDNSSIDETSSAIGAAHNGSAQVFSSAEQVQNMETKEELDSSNIQDDNVTPTNEFDANTQNEANQSSYTEEYNILLNKYYEIENDRQQILQQLHQYSNWNQQFPVSTTPTAQQYQAPVAQPYATVAPVSTTPTAQQYRAPVAQPYGCSYGCQLLPIPCIAMPTSYLGGYNVDKCCQEIPRGSRNGNSMSPEVPDFVKTAMVASERALSLTKEANGEKEQRGMEIGQIPESNIDKDLQVVLNAWYSAGFHTGKYVSGQSSDMRKHD